MKRISKYAALLAVLAGLLVMGCDGGNGGGNEPVSPLTITNGTVISCDRTTKGTVEIPSNVTVIKDYAFSGCAGLTEVSIPSSVRSIGDYAFSGCTGLSEISIPSSIKSVGQNAFAGCSNLTIQYAGTKAEWDKLGVDTKDVTVVCRGGTVSGEGQGDKPVTYTVTFYPNVPLDAVGSGLSPVSQTYAAGSTSQFPEDLFSLDGYRLVGWATNADDSSVPNVGSNFAVHEDRSFYAVWEAVIDIPANGLVIKDNVVVEYRPDSGVTAVTIPSGVTAIGDSAFSGCAGVTSVVIPYGVTSIGSSAFAGCSGLVSVEIPASVTSVGSGAFSGCSSLTIHYNGTRARWESLRIETYGVPVVCADDGQGSEDPSGVLTVQNGIVVKCDPAATGFIEIHPGVTEIAANAFSNCISIKGVVIPEGVTSIGNGAFRYCSDMLSVEIPGSVTYIGDKAFEYCDSIKTVNFTGTIEQLITLGLDTKGFGNIGAVSVMANYGKPGKIPCHFVDSGDKALTGYVIIPNMVTAIKDKAFYECTDIVGVVIHRSVTSIGEYAFAYCERLTSIIFNGTIAQWKDIDTGTCLAHNSGTDMVTCIDGETETESVVVDQGGSGGGGY